MSLTEEEQCLEEYKVLRDELKEKQNSRTFTLLYLTLALGAVYGAAFQTGKYLLSLFAMPLMFPLLVWWNANYLAIRKIGRYFEIRTVIVLKHLKWEKLAGGAVHPQKLLSLVYTLIGVGPAVYFAMPTHSDWVSGPKGLREIIIYFDIACALAILIMTALGDHYISGQVEQMKSGLRAEVLQNDPE